MRILTITDDCPPYALGGSGRIAWETSTGLSRRGHEVHLLTAAAIGSSSLSSLDTHIGGASVTPSSATRDDMRVHLLPELPKRWAHYRSVFSGKRMREVLRVIEEVQPDLIHAHGLAWQMGYRWIAQARAKGIPILSTAHGVMHVAYGKMLGTETVPQLHDLRRARWTYNPLRNLLVKRALMQCNVILCVSDALRMYLEHRGYSHLRTLRNGIDLAFWKSVMSQNEARNLLGIPLEQTVFLLAGRIGEDKGASVIDRALPESSLLLAAGDVPEGTFPKSNAKVRIFPRQNPEQMRLLYCACDVVLVPSLYLDPFPTVTLEGSACSRPVVATSFGGAKEAVLDGTTGWILDPRDEKVLREKMKWCVAHRTELDGFGASARAHIEKNFSLEHHLDKLLGIYASMSHQLFSVY